MSLKLWRTRLAQAGRRYMLAAVIVPGLALAIGAMAGPSLARSAASRTVYVLRANEIGPARFGESPAVVIGRLNRLLGRRPSQRYRRMRACNVDHAVAWPGLAVFFHHRRFVGYSYRTANGSGPLPTLATGKGLRVGDTLVTGRRLYGRSFHDSGYHGGSWWATTPGGLVKGFVSGWPGGPRGSVATIAAGHMGCPVTTP